MTAKPLNDKFSLVGRFFAVTVFSIPLSNTVAYQPNLRHEVHGISLEAINPFRELCAYRIVIPEPILVSWIVGAELLLPSLVSLRGTAASRIIKVSIGVQ